MEQQMQLGFGDLRPCYPAAAEAEPTHPPKAAPDVTREVFATIRDAGQTPFWAYQSGNERLSCVFCIMGSRSDLANGRKHRPELYQEYIEIEEETGWTMFADESLAHRSATP